MADNVELNSGSGGATMATDDVAGVHYQIVKLADGTDQGTGLIGGDATNGLDVDVTRSALPTGASTSAKQDTIIGHVDGIEAALAGTLTVGLPTGAATAAKQDTIIGHVDGIEALLGTIDADTGNIATAVTGVSTAAKQDTIIGHVDGIEGLLGTIDADTGTIAGAVVGLALESGGNLAAAATSLALIDDAVFAEDVAAQAAAKGVSVLAVRRDADTSLVDTDNDYAQLQVNNLGALKVEIFDGGDSHTVDGTVTANAGTNLNTSALLTTAAHDAAFGTAGSADAQVRTIQGVASMTPVQVSQATASNLNATVVGTGTLAVQVDGAALTALQLIDNPVLVDDAAFTPASSSVTMAGFEADETATDSVDEGDAGAARMTLTRKQIVTAQPHTAGGLTIHRSIDLDEGTLEVVKNSPGCLYAMWAANTATTTRFIKFYDATSGTAGTGTPVLTIPIPGNASDDITGVFNAGGLGITFATGICVGATTGVADADTGAPAANDVIVNIFFL